MFGLRLFFDTIHQSIMWAEVFCILHSSRWGTHFCGSFNSLTHGSGVVPFSFPLSDIHGLFLSTQEWFFLFFFFRFCRYVDLGTTNHVILPAIGWESGHGFTRYISDSELGTNLSQKCTNLVGKDIDISIHFPVFLYMCVRVRLCLCLCTFLCVWNNASIHLCQLSVGGRRRSSLRTGYSLS